MRIGAAVGAWKLQENIKIVEPPRTRVRGRVWAEGQSEHGRPAVRRSDVRDAYQDAPVRQALTPEGSK